MTRHITIIQGHPDAQRLHFGHAVADAYADGARAAGHDVRTIEVAKLDFPILRSAEDFYTGKTPEALLSAQETIRWADHLLVVYPLWHGHFPALFHAFFEQTFRPGFAVQSGQGGMPKKLFKGKSARIVVTMGMPGLFYRWYYCAHSLKSLERNVLRFCGIGPVRATLIGWMGAGAVGGRTPDSFENDYPHKNTKQRERALEKIRRLGRDGR